jgi:hypothetical protein
LRNIEFETALLTYLTQSTLKISEIDCAATKYSGVVISKPEGDFGDDGVGSGEED